MISWGGCGSQVFFTLTRNRHHTTINVGWFLVDTMWPPWPAGAEEGGEEGEEEEEGAGWGGVARGCCGGGGGGGVCRIAQEPKL